MSSDATAPTREQTLAYLLGELPPQELARIDQLLLTDDEFADSMEETRHELLDAYARGKVSAEERERVRRALNLAAGDFSVGFSRALHRALERLAADRSRSGKPPSNDTMAPATRAAAWHRRARWALPLAACLVLAIGGWWLWPRGGPGGAPAPGSAFVLLLQPQVLRGPTAARDVSLPVGQQALDVQVVVPGASKRYAVRVHDASGQWTYPDLTALETGGVRFIQFVIPRARVHSGEYRFEVFRAADRRRPLWRYRVRLHAH